MQVGFLIDASRVGNQQAQKFMSRVGIKKYYSPCKDKHMWTCRKNIRFLAKKKKEKENVGKI